MNTMAGYLSIIFYIATFYLLFIQCCIKKQSYADTQAIEGESKFTHSRKLVLLAWLIAIVCHAAYLYMPLVTDGFLSLNLTFATSHILCITSAVLLITLLSHKVEVLGLFIIPLAIAFNVFNLIFPPDSMDDLFLMGSLGVHILVSLLGYSLLALATAQAILLHLQNKQLHNHTPHGLLSLLPALQDMEKLLFHLLMAGVLFLGAALVTGFLFLEDMFKQHVVHKTILSIVAFILYSVLLFGHWQFGWRGKKAIKLTLYAFAFLVVGFMGSKLVYEFLINQ